MKVSSDCAFLAFVLMASGSDQNTMAFAPTASSGSSPRVVVGVTKGSFIAAPLSLVGPTQSSGHGNMNRGTSTTALQMSLFDRFFRVAKSNVNLVLSNLEDPEKIMDQAVIDMQKDLVKVRQTYAEVTATQRRLQEQKKQHEAIAQDWYLRAQLALQRGMDDLARQALTRRQVALDEAQAVQQQLDVNGGALDKLYESMNLLDGKILDAKSKKDQMAARARTAKTTMKVNDMLSGVTGKTSMDAFKRMEQKVEALEAAAEASAEMGSLAAELPDASLEREFLALEASASVDEELKLLQDELKQHQQRALQPGRTNPEQEFRVEQELRTMKEKSSVEIPVRWNNE